MSKTTTLGGAGGFPFNMQCPAGEYIDMFYGTSDSYPSLGANEMTSLGAKCSDGTDLGKQGSEQGNTQWNSPEYSAPISNFSGYFGYSQVQGGAINGSVNSFMGYGGPIINGQMGSPWSDHCPSGSAVGLYGNAGSVVNLLGVTCGTPSKWCIDHLEDPMCEGVSDDILNQACELNFTKTCSDKRNRLTDTTMSTYCQKNPTKDICACYAKAPSYIPAAIEGLPQCWSKACADGGYIPSNARGEACPAITICTQDMDTTGSSNVLTGNIVVQNCSTSTGTNMTSPTGSNTSNGKDTDGIPALPTANPPTDMILIILLCVLLSAIVTYMIMQGDQFKPNQPSQPSQPNQPY